MKFLIGIGLVVGLLAGCAGVPPVQVRLAIACSSYGHALQSLAPLKSSMSQKDIQKVDGIRKIANPICLERDYQSVQSALDTVSQAVAKMNGIEVKYDQ